MQTSSLDNKNKKNLLLHIESSGLNSTTYHLPNTEFPFPYNHVVVVVQKSRPTKNTCQYEEGELGIWSAAYCGFWPSRSSMRLTARLAATRHTLNAVLSHIFCAIQALIITRLIMFNVCAFFRNLYLFSLRFLAYTIFLLFILL